MKKWLCDAYLGPDVAVRIYVTDEGDQGSCSCPYAGKKMSWHVCVGVGRSWGETFITLLHELFETAAILQKGSFVPDHAWGDKSDRRLFLFGHGDFEEMCACVGDVLLIVAPRLEKAWREFHKSKKEKRKKKKKK
jgi:hypothetical protein